eukprot:CAMPEP_0171309698 /NCGR_PEP_ID=MMETSP0816-20121228/19889_1 /TAXON_ID=420281 /ORGANISM="Proboscia inermis, Strain CCAP1064/1" /LENGTH=218 /DNA_ID=CAMNT_0011793423 /DNA_START=75 /DNA_END=731 /DNA_ORIENTATION=-
MPAKKKTAASSHAGRKPAHQNTYAFHHNPKSKKTDKILGSANVGLCRRCTDKIEWRKKYRKYKPLSQPAVCNKCHKRTIKAAYHTICSKCAITTTKKDLPTPACIEVSDNSTKQEVITTRMCAMCTTEPVTNQNDDEKAELNMEGLKLRERKTLERQRAREEQRQKNAENDENEIKNESEIEDDGNDDESTKISCDDCEEIMDNEGESAVNQEIPKIQ